MSPWKVILATMVIFTCGVITGTIVTKTAPAPQMAAAPDNPRPPAGPVLALQKVEFLRKLEKKMVLTPEQQGQIAAVMKASQERTQQVREQIAPQMTEERKRVRDEIRAVLTPEQRKKFAELMKSTRKGDAAPPGPRSGRPLESNTTATNAADTNAL